MPFGLELVGTKMTAAGLKDLAGLKNLATLDLRGTSVTGVGLKNLAGLANLTTLYLDTSTVTDASLRSLRETDLLHALILAAGQNGSAPSRRRTWSR